MNKSTGNGMLARLKIVDNEALFAPPSELLIITPRGSRRVHVEEQDIPVPLISLLLHDAYTLGEPIDSGVYGVQMGATIPYVWGGRLRYLVGAVVPLRPGLLIALPLGFFFNHPAGQYP